MVTMIRDSRFPDHDDAAELVKPIEGGSRGDQQGSVWQYPSVDDFRSDVADDMDRVLSKWANVEDPEA
jgi:hypothetical protein